MLPNAVPSQFQWTKVQTPSQANRVDRAKERETKKRKIDERICKDLEDEFNQPLDCSEVVVETEETSCDFEFSATPLISQRDFFSQTDTQPLYRLDNFRSNDKAIHFYTGLESYVKLLFVLSTLGPAAYCLDYIYHNVVTISVPDQFFITLIKLRRYTTNYELSIMFNISQATVKNIVFTWIAFMARQWRELNIWPSRNLVRYFSPSDFKAKFPTTRVIVDGTECPVKKPKAPCAQQSTFSTYKNRNTIKTLIGATPGGLVSFISPVYGGSTSDRQIVERCNLTSICDPGDSIMADKGFNVQDLFAPMDVAINMPAFFKKKNRLSGKVVLRDRKLSSKRVHIERIIGLGKTYKILCCPMTSTEAKLSSEIVFDCYMLCNFRTCIVSKHA